MQTGKPVPKQMLGSEWLSSGFWKDVTGFKSSCLTSKLLFPNLKLLQTETILFSRVILVTSIYINKFTKYGNSFNARLGVCLSWFIETTSSAQILTQFSLHHFPHIKFCLESNPSFPKSVRLLSDFCSLSLRNCLAVRLQTLPATSPSTSSGEPCHRLTSSEL
jgi:hypothetical protein